jgi:hypothetical protein
MILSTSKFNENQYEIAKNLYATFDSNRKFKFFLDSAQIIHKNRVVYLNGVIFNRSQLIKADSLTEHYKKQQVFLRLVH